MRERSAHGRATTALAERAAGTVQRGPVLFPDRYVRRGAEGAGRSAIFARVSGLAVFFVLQRPVRGRLSSRRLVEPLGPGAAALADREPRCVDPPRRSSALGLHGLGGRVERDGEDVVTLDPGTASRRRHPTSSWKAARSPTTRAEAKSRFLTGVCLIDGKTSPGREEHVACHGTDACHVKEIGSPRSIPSQRVFSSPTVPAEGLPPRCRSLVLADTGLPSVEYTRG